MKDIENAIIVRFMGGLGNQMFQYALYAKLLYLGNNVKADLSSYSRQPDVRPFILNKIFSQVSLNLATMVEVDYWRSLKSRKPIYNYLQKHLTCNGYQREKEDGNYVANVLKMQYGMLVGYWQSECYFKDIKEIIKKQFSFYTDDESLLSVVASLKKDDCSVSIHIRRGDYLNHPELYGNICTIEYYEKAIKYFKEKYANAVFYVFTDDIDWVENNLRKLNYKLMRPDMFNHYCDWYDMFLMSECKHNIIANSSFSWWGAWLNDNLNKKIIAPSKWLNSAATKDIWCDDWIKL